MCEGRGGEQCHFDGFFNFFRALYESLGNFAGISNKGQCVCVSTEAQPGLDTCSIRRRINMCLCCVWETDRLLFLLPSSPRAPKFFWAKASLCLKQAGVRETHNHCLSPRPTSPCLLFCWNQVPYSYPVKSIHLYSPPRFLFAYDLLTPFWCTVEQGLTFCPGMVLVQWLLVQLPLRTVTNRLCSLSPSF